VQSFKIFCLAISVYLSVSAEDVVKLSVHLSVSAESLFITFGMVSFSAETKNLASVGLYFNVRILHKRFHFFRCCPRRFDDGLHYKDLKNLTRTKI
jgi:hypothetical protein